MTLTWDLLLNPKKYFLREKVPKDILSKPIKIFALANLNLILAFSSPWKLDVRISLPQFFATLRQVYPHCHFLTH